MDKLYSFNWNKIPGSDTKIFKKLLRENFDIDLVRKAKIVKINDSKTIRVFDGKNYLSLSINDNKTVANLIINGKRSDKFIFKIEDVMLCVYKFEEIYYDVDTAKLIENIRNNYPKFNPSDIPKEAPENPLHAYIIRRIALYIDDEKLENQGDWQNYWFRCCISEKCDYIFSILKLRHVNREEDLLKICNPESKLWKKAGDERIKINIDLCIDFFLKRYNLMKAFSLCWNYPSSKIHLNWIELFFPRMIAGIFVGFLPIITSNDLMNFIDGNQSNLKLYAFFAFMFILTVIYFLYECYKITQKTLDIEKIFMRISPVLMVSSIEAFLISIIFAYVGLFGDKGWVLSKIIFYAMFALFIGILAQLLWEEKTATEPL